MVADMGGDDNGGTTLDQESYFASTEYSDKSFFPVLEIVYDVTDVKLNNSKKSLCQIVDIKSISGNSLELYLEKNQTVSISVFTLDGRNILSINSLKLMPGINNVTLPQKLSMGAYMVKVNYNLNTTIKKLIVR